MTWGSWDREWMLAHRTFPSLAVRYGVMESGVPNFCAVSLALIDLGYVPKGIRLDSGDLAYLSCESRKYIDDIADRYVSPLW